MPQHFWRHVCGGREVLRTSPRCRGCGAEGVSDGWRLRWWEDLVLYHYIYGLNPIGPHRQLADGLFAGMRDPCVRCGGRAVLAIVDGRAWRACPDCEGTGGVWNRPFEEVDAAWRKVVARWPRSAIWELPMGMNPGAPASVRNIHAPGEAGSPISNAVAAGPASRPSPQAMRRPRRKSSGGTAKPRRSGYSSHGLRFTDVQRAFAEAERLLGTGWQLKGRGHCRRVSLDARYSAYAVKGARRSWVLVTPHRSMTPRRLMPLAIVAKAAEILDAPAHLLICREW